jgi:hypothetical protein
MKHLFVHLEVQNGEYRYSCKSVHVTKAKNIKLVGERHAASFYSNMDGRNGDWWEFNGGEVAVRLYSVKEITNYEYNTLKNYL